jgi:hypothetical protein
MVSFANPSPRIPFLCLILVITQLSHRSAKEVPNRWVTWMRRAAACERLRQACSRPGFSSRPSLRIQLQFGRSRCLHVHVHL